MSVLLSGTSYPQTVGLVLSGGGAKGLAHIGVIRELEKNGIPIDYITGTSIGAIIAALYASGYSPDEMEALFRSDDFYFWSTGKIQEKYRYFFSKEEPGPDWLEIKFQVEEDKLKVFPPSYLTPQGQMDFAFMQLLAAPNAVAKSNFDSLMVPFRCVASDVYKNKVVVLKQGDLGEAVRASMTVPLYFKPITIDGELLFDGGLYNNFPNDVMKEVFHPDIIIGHKVSTDQEKPGQDDLRNQLTNLIMRPTRYELSPKDGIFMESRFDNVGLMDFKRINFIENQGTLTARAMIDSIKNRVARRVPAQEVERKRAAFKRKMPGLLFRYIQVEGISDPMQRKFIIQSIKHNKDVITLEEFRKAYFKLLADEQIKSIYPVASYNDSTGYFNLHLKVEPEKKLKVQFGGNVSTKPVNQGYLNVGYRLFKDRSYTLNSNIYFGRFYSSFKAGGRIDFPTRPSWYLLAYSTLNRWDYFSSSGELFFEDVRPPYIIQEEYNLRMEAGFPLGVHNKFSTGIAYSNADDEYYQTRIFLKEDTPDKTDFKAFVTHLGFESNSQNYKQFATEGIYQDFELKYITGKEINYPGSTSTNILKSSADHNFFLLTGIHDKYYTLSRLITLGTLLEGVYSNKKPFNNYTASVLSAPGFYPTPHSKSMFIENFHSNKFLAGGLRTIFNLKSQLQLRFEGYLFAPIDPLASNPAQEAEPVGKIIEKTYFQGMGALVYQTGAGPLSLTANYYEKTGTKLYITLNFGYILFNKRGF